MSDAEKHILRKIEGLRVSALIEAFIEHDELGESAFLDKYKANRNSQAYVFKRSDKQYDLREIVAAALKYQYHTAIVSSDFHAKKAAKSLRKTIAGHADIVITPETDG